MKPKEIVIVKYLTDNINRRNMTEFNQAAREAGFSLKQIEFLEEFVAKMPHSHTAEEIIGLDDYVEQLVEDEDDEEDNDEIA
jgi:hypothetical protein